MGLGGAVLVMSRSDQVRLLKLRRVVLVLRLFRQRVRSVDPKFLVGFRVQSLSGLVTEHDSP